MTPLILLMLFAVSSLMCEEVLTINDINVLRAGFVLVQHVSTDEATVMYYEDKKYLNNAVIMPSIIKYTINRKSVAMENIIKDGDKCLVYGNELVTIETYNLRESEKIRRLSDEIQERQKRIEKLEAEIKEKGK